MHRVNWYYAGFQMQDHEDGSHPRIVELSKKSSGGISLKFKHINPDDDLDGSTILALKVDFWS